MNRALIFGASGFVGSQLLEHFSNFGSIAVGSSRTNSDHMPYSEALRKAKAFDTIVHAAAAIPDSAAENTQDRMCANIELAKEIAAANPRAHHIYLSSVSIFAPATKTIHNHSPLSRTDAYGLSKQKAEQILARTRYATILRPSSILGVGMKSHTFVPLIMETAILKGEIELYGSGQRLQNYIAVSDVCAMILKCAHERRFGTYMATSPTSISNAHIAQTIQTLTNAEIRYRAECDEGPSFRYRYPYETWRTLRHTPIQTILNSMHQHFQQSKWKQYS